MLKDNKLPNNKQRTTQPYIFQNSVCISVGNNILEDKDLFGISEQT